MAQRDGVPANYKNRYRLLRIMRWLRLSSQKQAELSAPMQGKTDEEKEIIAAGLLEQLPQPEPQTPVNNVFFGKSAAGSFRSSNIGRNPYEAIFCFPLQLDIGRIGDGALGAMRQEDAARLWPQFSGEGSEREIEQITARLSRLLSSASDGEITRIWYSEQGEDLCGLYWLLSELGSLPWHGSIRLIKLPHLELRQDMFTEKFSWGQLSPQDFDMCLSLEETADAAFYQPLIQRWKTLVAENAMLRVSIGGELCSVPEDFWDWHILGTLREMPDEFKQAEAVGKMLCPRPAPIQLDWICYRMENMVREGLLEYLTRPAPGEARWHGTMKKTARFQAI